MFKVEKIHFSYPKCEEVLRGVSFELPEKKLSLLKGKNGDGKTTLLKTICGIIEPTNGSFHYNNQDISRKRSQLVSWVPAQDHSFFPRLTGIENLEYFCLSGNSFAQVQERINELSDIKSFCKALGIPYYQSSSGMKQILSIARSYIQGRPIVVMDEPTRSLDPEVRGDFKELIHKLLDSHTVLLSSHTLEHFDSEESLILTIEGGTVV